LPAETQAFFEPRFSTDFSSVRIHDGTAAAASAETVNAAAYTSGDSIVFGSGRYSPHTHRGRHLLAHELTHVVQQRGETGIAAQSLARRRASDGQGEQGQRPDEPALNGTSRGANDLSGRWTAADRSSNSAPGATIQRQRADSSAGEGGPAGSTETAQPARLGEMASGSGKAIADATEAGWRQVRNLDATTLATANVDQRMTMLGQLIQAYWTGGKEEEAIIRIVRTTPLAQAPSLVGQLDSRTINGKPFTEELDRVVDAGNNQELHLALSDLRLKAMGPDQGSKALESAPVLPWHDVMGFFEQEAVFSFSRTRDGKVQIKYPARLFNAEGLGGELKQLPTDIFIGGHVYERDQVLIIHDHDNGRFVPIVAQELLGYQHAGVRGFLGHVATVASFAIPVSAAESLAAKAAVLVLERVLPAAFLLIDENRLNLVKWFPNWGPRMIRYADIAKVGLAVYGVGRFAFSGWQIFKNWKDVRKARAALEGAAADPKAEQVALALEQKADEIFSEVEKVRASSPAPGKAGPGSAESGLVSEVEGTARGARPQEPAAPGPSAGERAPRDVEAGATSEPRPTTPEPSDAHPAIEARAPGSKPVELPQGGRAQVTPQGRCTICHSPCKYMLDQCREALDEARGTRHAGYLENLLKRIQRLEEAMIDSSGRGALGSEYPTRFQEAHRILSSETEAAYLRYVMRSRRAGVAAAEEIEAGAASRPRGLVDEPSDLDYAARAEKALTGTAYHDVVKARMLQDLPAGTAFTEDTIQAFLQSRGVKLSSIPSRSTGIDLYVLDRGRNLITPVDITNVAGSTGHIAKLQRDWIRLERGIEATSLRMSEPLEIEYVGKSLSEAASKIIAELRAYAR
jgi:hypothetical protein